MCLEIYITFVQLWVIGWITVSLLNTRSIEFLIGRTNLNFRVKIT